MEPRTVAGAEDAAVEVAGLRPPLRRARGDRARSTSRPPTARCVGVVGPSGCGKSTLLELIAGLLEPSAGLDRGRRRAGAEERLAALRLHAAARPAAAVADGARQRGARTAQPRRLARRRAGRGARRCSSASASPGSRRRDRTSSPAACASGSPSCARCWPTSRCCCSTSRSPRSTRSRGPRCRSGWPRRWRAAGDRAAGHPRRRGGALPLRPRRWCSAPARRARGRRSCRRPARDRRGSRRSPRRSSPRRASARSRRSPEGSR